MHTCYCEGVDFDDLFEKAAEAGAEDVTDDGDVFTVVTGQIGRASCRERV